jgi:hypothetical protein
MVCMSLIDIMNRLGQEITVFNNNVKIRAFSFLYNNLYIDGSNIKLLIVYNGHKKYIYKNLINVNFAYHAKSSNFSEKTIFEFVLHKFEFDELKNIKVDKQPFVKYKNAICNKKCDILTNGKESKFNIDNLFMNENIFIHKNSTGYPLFKIFPLTSMFLIPIFYWIKKNVKKFKFNIMNKKPKITYVQNYEENKEYIVKDNPFEFHVNLRACDHDIFLFLYFVPV